MIPDNVQISTLSNGLTFITINQPWNQGIYCHAYVKVGSCDEQLVRDKGICHFIEHMVFRGTENYTEEQINKMITGRGGYFNGATSYSYTQYDMWTQREYFGDTISILDNLVFKPIINSDILNIEKEIIIEEAMEQKSDPFQQAILNNNKILYPKHNFQYPIIGTTDSINNITSTRIKEYLRGYYRPQTMLLIICGNLPDQNELEDILYTKAHGFVRKTRASNSSAIQRKFGEFNSPPNDIYNKETWDDIKSSVSITSYVFNAKEIYKKDRVALQILTNIIGGDSNSLMFKQIRNDGGLCYNCGAFSTILMDNLGSYSFALFSRNTKIKQAEEKLDKILIDISKGKIQEDNISEAKNSLVGNYMRGLESGSYFSRVLASCYLDDSGKYGILPWEYSDIIKKTNKKHIVNLAQQILSNPKARYVILNKE